MITEEFRLRKVCPKCSSLNVGKNKKHGTYKCKSCGAVFQNAKLKEVKTNRNMIPEQLRKIIEKKQNAALGCDKP